MSKVAAVPKNSLYDASRPLYHVEMTFDEFAAIERCPVQRNEQNRIKKSHFRAYSPTQLSTSIAVLPTGRTIKLDGHGRVGAAQAGYAPHLLKMIFNVTVYPVKTIEEAIELHNQFDSAASVKTAADSVTGGYLLHDIQPETNWIAAGKIADSLNISYAAWARSQNLPLAVSHFDRVECFSKEIMMLDGINPNKGMFKTGAVAAALLSFKKFGVSAVNFFQEYNDGPGKELGNRRDAVRMLHEYFNKERHDRTMQGLKNNLRHVQMVLPLLLRSFSGQTFYEKFPSAITPSEFLKK